MSMTMRERYQIDNHFHTLVDMMMHFIQEAKYTPSEMREAAILASIIYEERNIKQMVFIEKNVEEALRTLGNRVDR